MRAFVRPPLQFPEHCAGASAVAMETGARSAMAAWPGAHEVPGLAAWLAGPGRPATALRHPLSAHWLARRAEARDDRPARDPVAEQAFVAQQRPALAAALAAADPRCFQIALEHACELATDGRVRALRQRSIGLDADRDGTGVVFGDWRHVSHRLACLHEALRSSALPPLLAGAAAWAVLLNIHPFMDGNGRCARLLFHAVADPGGQRAVLPLRTLVEHADGGFELSLREAELYGRWDVLFAHLAQAFGLIGRYLATRTHLPHGKVSDVSV